MTTSFLRRCRQRTFDRPAVVETSAQRAVSQASNFAPSARWMGFAAKCQDAIAREIALLLGFCCPSAIAWFVVTIVVDAIHGMLSRWSWAHIRIKGFETCHPPIAYRNASSGVATMMAVRTTAFFDALPDLVFGHPHQRLLRLGHAPAVHRIALLQLLRGLGGGVSAVAAAFPCGIAREAFVAQCARDKMSESAVGQIGWSSRHGVMEGCL